MSIRGGPTGPAGFRHDALLYSGTDQFVREMTSFVVDGLEREEPVLVVVVPPKIDLLRESLGDWARDVRFADMAEIGRNPSRIIPVWKDFVDTFAGETPVRGIGEPIWASRTPDELVEAQRHEALINLAFEGAPAWILCPYDTASLDGTVIDEAFRSHPVVSAGGHAAASDRYRGLDAIAAPFAAPLPPPPPDHVRLPVETGGLGSIRRFLAGYASAAGMRKPRVHDLVLAVNEVATNTLRHSPGPGVFRAWQEDDAVVVEVSDGGLIDHPLAGREAPRPEQESGMGLWIVNQLCDLVQVRALDEGSLVRLRMSR